MVDAGYYVYQNPQNRDFPDEGAKIPYASWPKNHSMKNRSNIATNSIKTLKMVPFQIKKKKKPAECTPPK